MTEDMHSAGSGTKTPGIVILLAWLFVGVPLIWGVSQTQHRKIRVMARVALQERNSAGDMLGVTSPTLYQNRSENRWPEPSSTGAATIPAMISQAVGLPKLNVQPAPNRLPTMMPGSSRLT